MIPLFTHKIRFSSVVFSVSKWIADSASLVNYLSVSSIWSSLMRTKQPWGRLAYPFLINVLVSAPEMTWTKRKKRKKAPNGIGLLFLCSKVLHLLNCPTSNIWVLSLNLVLLKGARFTRMVMKVSPHINNGNEHPFHHPTDAPEPRLTETAVGVKWCWHPFPHSVLENSFMSSKK